MFWLSLPWFTGSSHKTASPFRQMLRRARCRGATILKSPHKPVLWFSEVLYRVTESGAGEGFHGTIEIMEIYSPHGEACTLWLSVIGPHLLPFQRPELSSHIAVTTPPHPQSLSSGPLRWPFPLPAEMLFPERVTGLACSSPSGLCFNVTSLETSSVTTLSKDNPALTVCPCPAFLSFSPAGMIPDMTLRKF